MNGNLLAGKYLVQELIGKGGIGEIYKAVDKKKKRVVAIKKLMSLDKVRKRRFKREYRLLDKIDHPFFVRSFDYFEHQEYAYLVMEFVDGKTLKEVITKHKDSFSLPEQLAMANKIARAVEIINLAGIIHRDIKPDNIMIDNETGDIKLLDLGLAKDTTYSTVNITKGDHFLGTPLYASPEQVKGEQSYRSDIFSLCTVLYQFFLWEDRSPFFDQNEFAILYKITDYQPPSLMEKILLSKKQLTNQEKRALQNLSDLLRQGMEKNPEKRPENANYIADTLAQIQQDYLHFRKDNTNTIRIQLSNPVDRILSKKLATIRISSDDIHGMSKSDDLPLSNLENTYLKGINFVQKNWLLGLISLSVILFVFLIIIAFTLNSGNDFLNSKNQKEWIKVQGYSKEASLLFDKAMTSEKTQNRELLIKSKHLYLLAQKKAYFFLEKKILLRKKQQNISKKQAKKYILKLFKNNVVKMQNWKNRANKINVMLGQTSKIPFNKKIWNTCWTGSLFDFTTPIWVNLSPKKQREYATKYQYWYAKKINKKTEKSFSLGKVSLKMILIPPGEFWVGSSSSEIGRSYDEEKRKITIKKPYWLGKYELTQLQWEKIVNEKPWQGKRYMHNNQAHPATYISWEDVNKRFLPKVKKEFDFPTENQWEYACRAGTISKFFWGDNISSIGRYANIMDQATTAKYPQLMGIEVIDGFSEVAPVGSLGKNAFQLYDVSGNVSEWCRENYNNFSKKENKFKDYKVRRGSGWDNFSINNMRSAHRNKSKPQYRSQSTGVRLCYNLK